MYTPKISIIIPAYNASNYLAEAIDSALAQTYSNVEIIVVNDGSDDGGKTEQIALSYGERIRYFCKENGGSSSALNVGVANMTGEWFSWLSHDDLYLPEKIEKQVEYLRALKLDVESLMNHVFFSAWDLIDASGKTIRKFNKNRAKTMERRVCEIPHNGYLIAEPTTYIFHGCSCLVHKDVFSKIGGFDENLRWLNDVDFWFRLYAAGYKVHFISDVLVKGRVHRAQVSKSIGYSYHNPEQDMYWNRSLDWLLEHCPEDEKLLLLFGRNAYLKTRTSEGDRAFKQIKNAGVKLKVLKFIWIGQVTIRNCVKNIYLSLKNGFS